MDKGKDKDKANGKEFGLSLILLAFATAISFGVDLWRGSPPNAAVCILIGLIFVALVGAGSAFYRGVFLFSISAPEPVDATDKDEGKL